MSSGGVRQVRLLREMLKGDGDEKPVSDEVDFGERANDENKSDWVKTSPVSTTSSASRPARDGASQKARRSSRPTKKPFMSQQVREMKEAVEYFKDGTSDILKKIGSLKKVIMVFY